MSSIEKIINKLQDDRFSPSELLNLALEDLRGVHNHCFMNKDIVDRFNLVEACMRLIYLKGHRMHCARSYLLGRITRYEMLL